MKRALLLVFLGLVLFGTPVSPGAEDSVGQDQEEGWSNWSYLTEGIFWRTRLHKYIESEKKYWWYYQFKNEGRYNVKFSYVVYSMSESADGNSGAPKLYVNDIPTQSWGYFYSQYYLQIRVKEVTRI